MPPVDPALPFGLRDVKLRPIDASGVVGASVDLPNARTLSFTETEDFEELRGDDKQVAIRGKGSGVDWDLESGGLPIAAYKIIAGGTSTTSGTTPNSITTFTKKSTDARPYFQVEGQAISDSGGDVHVLLYRCRATGDITGEMADGAFWLTGCSGRALGDATDTVYDMVINETAVAIT
jgi:hypothetical protein